MTEAQIEKKKRRTTSAYPKNNLESALKISDSIVRNNAGEPFNRILLGESLDLSPNGSTMRTLVISSRKYGLTNGGYNAKMIELTDLGRSIVQPRSEEERNRALLDALFNVPFYRDFFTKYDNQTLPRDELLRNILNREYDIPTEVTESCLDLINDNAQFLNIIQESKGNRYIILSNLKSNIETVKNQEDVEIIESLLLNNLKVEKNLPEEVIEENKLEPPATWIPVVFISHSKNFNILGQIKQILEFGQFEFKIAEEVETTAIPIPEKIFGMMRQCTCAIINISADEQEKQEDGTYNINQNVLIEIGSCFLAYNKKVILLVDKRIELPSNLQGLYRCEYEGDELSWDSGIKLQTALKNFREPDL